MSTRRFLRLAGLVLSFLALAWIGLRFVQSGALDLLGHASVTPLRLAMILLGGACAYAATMLLPGLAWWRMLVSLSPSRPPAGQTLGTYAVSQFGKYLPGNVAHYALRHVWSRRYGIPHESLALASLLEAGLLVAGALALIATIGVRLPALMRIVDPRIAMALVVAAIAVLVIALYWLRHRGTFRHLHVPALPPSMLLACFACYCVFFAACALLVIALAHMLDFAIASPSLVFAATAASWLAGFVVVGAPAGLGVREAAFVTLTGAALGEDRALLLIGLFRIVTFLGDTLFMAAGAAILRIAPAAAVSEPRDARS